MIKIFTRLHSLKKWKEQCLIGVTLIIAVIIGLFSPFLLNDVSSLIGLAAILGFLLVTAFARAHTKWALSAYVVLIPVFGFLRSSFLPARSFGSSFSAVGAVKDILLIALVIGWVLSLSHKHPKIRFPNMIWVLVFEASALIAALRSPSLQVGLWAFRSVFEFLAIYIVVVNVLQSVSDAVVLLKYMLLGGLPVLIYGITIAANLQLGLGSEIYGGSASHIVGRLNLVGDQTTAGPYASFAGLLMVLAIAFYQFPSLGFKRVATIGIILAFPTLVLTIERRAWAASIVALVLLAVFTRRIRFLVATLIIIALSLLIVVLWKPEAFHLTVFRFQTGDASRLRIWLDYLQLAEENIFLGSGLGAAGNATLTFSDYYTSTPHNYFILLLVQGGLSLLLPFCFMVGNFIRLGVWRLARLTDPESKACGLVGVLAISTLIAQAIFSDFLETFPFNAYMWLFAGISAVSIARSFKSKRLETPNST